MTKIDDLKKIVREFKNYNILNDLEKALFENEAEILDMNIQQHTESGVNRDGVLISSYAPYADVTIDIKRLNGTLSRNDPSIVNLNDTEDYHDGYYIDKIKLGVYYIDSKDEKSSDLDKRYDEEIRGLVDKNMQKLGKDILLPSIEINLRKKLKLS